MRIAILTPTFLPKCSGAEVFHHNLASRLVEAGHSVTIIAPRGCVRKLRAQGWDLPYALLAYPDKFWNLLKRLPVFAFWLNRRALSSLQRKHRFDVWHAFVLYPAGVVLADWQRHGGAPGLVRAVGDDVSGLPGKGHAQHIDQCLREKLPSAAALVALSTEMAHELAALGVNPAKIHVIPNAVDAGRFLVSLSGKERSRTRQPLGIPDGAFVFLCVARNHPQKDFGTLLAAFRELRGNLADRNVHLVVAGRGTRELQSLATDLSGSIHFCEFGAPAGRSGVPTMPPPDLVALYLSADAFVLSSLLEGFSSAIIEAMVAGLPLAVTDAPGIRGVVTEGREGLLVPVRSPRMLAESMGKLVLDDSLRARLSGAARETAVRYSWPAVVAAYEKLYGDLIAAARK